MCKSVLADQFLGATFAKMIKKGIFEIELSQISQLEKQIDKSLRTMHNTMLLFSADDILTLVDEYNDFFCIKENVLTIHETITKEISKDFTQKDYWADTLQQYFTSGIPSNIYKTLNTVLNESF